MKVGFTGTRYGMSELQKLMLQAAVTINPPAEFHHGSCQGADVEAARIVREFAPKCRIVSHPGPDGDQYRELSGVDDETRQPKTHFARNRDIVDETDILLATPLQDEPQQRGGTWYTINYATKRGRKVGQFPRSSGSTEAAKGNT